MVVIATQRRCARRTVAIALFVLIPVVFGVLALLFLCHGPDDVSRIAPEATLTLLHRAPLKQASGDDATPPTSRPKYGSD